MKNLFEYTLEELAGKFERLGYKHFNARQVFSWIYKKRMWDFDSMSDLSKPLRTYLRDHFTLEMPRVKRRQVSQDGTIKFLLELADGHVVETVLMDHPYGKSLCVTVQIGCSLGCAFCASGLKQKVRDLSSGELIGQILAVEETEKLRISHLVLMGTGEPFDNYDAVMRFIRTVNCPQGLEIGARKITVSTSGLVPGIERFKDENLQVNLAVSLHAADDATRSRLMPINDVYPIRTLIDATQRYIEKTNRRVTFEYLLIDSINDSMQDADRLAKLLRGVNCYVNLIPYNPVDELPFRSVDEARHRAFYDRLIRGGLRVTSRREKGGDIDAACGQLRIKEARD